MAYAEDKVVCARHPKRAIGLEDAPSRLQSPDVSLEVLPEALRANRVTTSPSTLPGVLGRR